MGVAFDDSQFAEEDPSPNEALGPQLIDFLKGASYEDAEKVYEGIPGIPTVDDWLLAYLAQHDRYFLLTRVLRRADAIHPWLYERTREVEAEPYGRLDLWARGHYKALDGDTPIWTDGKGWVRHVDLVPGDRVMSSGGWRAVLANTGPQKGADCYEVTFSDNSTIIAAGDHLWPIQVKKRKRIKGSEKRKISYSTELVATRDLMASERRLPEETSVQMHGRGVPIPHYVLGAWLGDGHSADSRITCEDDIWQFMDWPEITDTSVAIARTLRGLRPLLRKLGVLHNKHIPDCYMMSDMRQRLDLLQGLMDTDGHVDARGTATFTQVDERLSRQVVHLIRTLGVRANIRAHYQIVNGERYRYFQVSFQTNKIIPFKLERKRKKCGGRAYPVRRYVKRVTRCATRDVNCIQVTDGEYLAGETFVPTHNSTIITFAGTIQEILNNPEVTIGIFSCTRPIAKAFLQQIKTECEMNPALHKLWPDIFWGTDEKPKVWGLDSGLTFKRKGNPKENTIEAWGVIDGQPTSKHFDILLFDDVVTAEYVGTPEMIQKTTDRLELSFNLGKPMSKGGREIFAGTRYAYGDTYQTLKDRGVFKPREYPATHDGTFDGEPVMLTQKEWDKLKTGTSRFTIACQQLLDPIAGSEQTFNPSHLRMYELRPKTLNVYILIDPANSKKKGSDRTACAVIGVDNSYNKYLLDGACHRMTLSERWELVRTMRAKWLRQPGVQLVKVGYEKYGMQTDIEHFQEKMTISGDYFEIVELSWTKDGQQSKADRVQRLQPDFENWQFFVPYSYETAVVIADYSREPPPDSRSKGEMTSSQKEVVQVGQSFLIAKPIRKVDEAGKMYDVTHFFINNEYMLFPSVHPDFMDAMSRIYDIGISPPRIVTRAMIEPPVSPDY